MIQSSVGKSSSRNPLRRSRFSTQSVPTGGHVMEDAFVNSGLLRLTIIALMASRASLPDTRKPR